MSDCGNCNADHNDTGLLDEYSSGKGNIKKSVFPMWKKWEM